MKVLGSLWKSLVWENLGTWLTWAPRGHDMISGAWAKPPQPSNAREGTRRAPGDGRCERRGRPRPGNGVEVEADEAVARCISVPEV